jgi:hypothetical protein
MSIETVISRINRMKAMTEPRSPEVRQALIRIGTVLQAQIRLNVDRYNIRGVTGYLRQSIAYKLEQSGDAAFVSVGSYGIKYAARNEFGGHMTRGQVRRMFVEMREAGLLSKAARGRKGKGIVTVNPDGTGYWRPRPFLRDALKSQSQFIIDTIRSIGKPE